MKNELRAAVGLILALVLTTAGATPVRGYGLERVAPSISAK